MIGVTEPKPRRGAMTPLAVGAGATLLAYLVWLGWDQPAARETVDSPGLFQPWQIIGLAVCLALIAGYLIWRGVGFVPLAVMPVTLAVARAVDAVGDAAFWPLEALYAGLGGTLVVVFALALVRPLRREDASSTRH
jgi:hypothetical protein